jgi:hypothetical protein
MQHTQHLRQQGQEQEQGQEEQAQGQRKGQRKGKEGEAKQGEEGEEAGRGVAIQRPSEAGGAGIVGGAGGPCPCVAEDDEGDHDHDDDDDNDDGDDDGDDEEEVEVELGSGGGGGGGSCGPYSRPAVCAHAQTTAAAAAAAATTQPAQPAQCIAQPVLADAARGGVGVAPLPPPPAEATEAELVESLEESLEDSLVRGHRSACAMVDPAAAAAVLAKAPQPTHCVTHWLLGVLAALEEDDEDQLLHALAQVRRERKGERAWWRGKRGEVKGERGKGRAGER